MRGTISGVRCTTHLNAERNGHEGLGKPEPLRHDLAGYWSRRITVKDRLIYSIDDKNIYIAACKGHYD